MNVDYYANNIRCVKKSNRRKYWQKRFEQNEKQIQKIKQKIQKENWEKYAVFQTTSFGDLFFLK